MGFCFDRHRFNRNRKRAVIQRLTEVVLQRRVPGLWLDVGSKESLEEANRVFAPAR
jgi:hypothetical protein